MKQLEEFKQNYPIGTQVRYYQIIGLKNHKLSVIRSDPWRLVNGEVAVKIKGVAGGVSINHIKPIAKYI